VVEKDRHWRSQRRTTRLSHEQMERFRAEGPMGMVAKAKPETQVASKSLEDKTSTSSCSSQTKQFPFHFIFTKHYSLSPFLFSPKGPLTKLLPRPRSLQLPLRLLIILRRIHTMLIMIHKVKPRNHMQKQPRISRVSARHALHIWCRSAVSIQRFSFLDFGDHLLHIHLDFSSIFCEAVESHCQSTTSAKIYKEGEKQRTNRPLVEEQKSSTKSNHTRKSHNRCKATLSHIRRSELFPR
jgi:hypothetical protein